MASSWDLAAVLEAQPARLSYSIHSTSGVYASFHPDHIRTDNPHSDTSRWTAPPPDHRRASSSNPPSTVGTKRRRDPEWIILELGHTALVRTIGFGKTSKPHPCNLADFTLWGGLSPDPLAMEPLLDATLKNDANPERFSLPISLPSGGTSSSAASATAPLPVRYLKIDCHVAANAAYSISIWHVWLEGYLPSAPASPSPSPLADMSTTTLEALYRAHRSRETTRLVLAHLRRAGPATLPAYRALAATLPSSPSPSSSSSALSPSASASSPAAPTTTGALEHPLLSALHDALVLEGDHARAESLLERMRRAGLLDEHCPGGGKGDSVARWVRLDAQGAGAGERGAAKAAPGGGPSGRGGHAMVRVGRRVLLYGGWDGEKDLGDLWEWSLDGHGGWRCLDEGLGGGAAGDEGGPSALKPGPRSCHQMAVDEGEGWVYLLGGRRDELDEDEEDEDEDDEPGAEPASTTAAAAMDLDADLPSSTAPARPAQGSPSSSPPTALDRALSRLQRRAARWRSDFWRYRAVGPNRGAWELLSADTRRDGGPALLFDHAMVVHSSARRLFVFGGKNQPFDAEAASGMGGGAGAAAMDDFGGEAGSAAGGGGAQREGRYSGMWCYDIEAKRWTHLFGDPRPTSFAPRPASPSSSERLLSRAGHALVLDESSPDDDPTLYVLHGQRNEQYLADEWAVRLASPSSSSSSAPAIGSSVSGDDTLWRQGAVLDFPSSAPNSAGSLVDTSAFPASSPSASPSRPSRSTRTDAHDSSTTSSRSRQPTIVQIRRLPAPAPAQIDTAAAVPPAGFTQRLTLGPHGAWTLLTGLGAAPTGSGSASSGGSTPERDRERERARERGEGEERCVRGVWRRVGGAKGRWERVKEEEGAAGEGPRGRYAAQVVYDPLKGEHYLFGGCPESPLPAESPDMRLSDFWKLKIVDPTPDEALRRAKFLVRKQRFAELCATSPTVLALQYLQNDLSLVVDHSSPSESAAFRACMAQLLAAPARMNIDADAALLAGASRPATPSEGADGPDEGACDVDEATYAARHALWEDLGAFVPRSMRQPDERLDDAARLLRVWGMGGWGALGA